MVLFLLCSPVVSPDAFALTESERVGMEFRIGYSRQMWRGIGSGPGYGVRILFISPHRFAGYVGGEIYTSHGSPLREVRLPGWSLISAVSTVYVMPAVIGGTYVVRSERTNMYFGGGASWVTLHERTKARYRSGEYVLTDWTNDGASGPGLHASVGMMYLFAPQFSAFAEIEGQASWIAYGSAEKVDPRSVALFAGIRF
ncbi:MAG: hypothetical protein ACE5JA_06160 [bacterium]